MDKIDYLHPTAIAQIKAVLNGEPVPDNTDNRDGHINDVRYLTPYAVEQIIEAGGSGASSADKVSYDNTESGLTATDVQGAIDETLEKVDAMSASKVSYSNATSGLTATTVQGAIDEVGANLGGLGVGGLVVRNNIFTRKAKTDELKVLLLTSSFGLTANHYVSKMLYADGCTNTKIDVCYSGSTGLSDWVEKIENDGIAHIYKYYTNVNGGNVQNAVQVNVRSIFSEQYDVIIFQQSPLDIYETNQTDNVVKLVRYLRGQQRNDVVMAMLENYAPPQNYIVNVMHKTKEEYIATARKVNAMMAICSGVDVVVPLSNVAEYIRDNYDTTQNEMATDTLHFDNGLPLFALSKCIYDSIYAKIFGVCSLTNTYIPISTDPKAPVTNANFIDVTSAQSQGLSLVSTNSQNYLFDKMIEIPYPTKKTLNFVAGRIDISINGMGIVAREQTTRGMMNGTLFVPKGKSIKVEGLLSTEKPLQLDYIAYVADSDYHREGDENVFVATAWSYGGTILNGNYYSINSELKDSVVITLPNDKSDQFVTLVCKNSTGSALDFSGQNITASII